MHLFTNKLFITPFSIFIGLAVLITIVLIYGSITLSKTENLLAEMLKVNEFEKEEDRKIFLIMKKMVENELFTFKNDTDGIQKRIKITMANETPDKKNERIDLLNKEVLGSKKATNSMMEGSEINEDDILFAESDNNKLKDLKFELEKPLLYDYISYFSKTNTDSAEKFYNDFIQKILLLLIEGDNSLEYLTINLQNDKIVLYFMKTNVENNLESEEYTFNSDKDSIFSVKNLVIRVFVDVLNLNSVLDDETAHLKKD